jgi:hypothetical protein
MLLLLLLLVLLLLSEAPAGNAFCREDGRVSLEQFLLWDQRGLYTGFGC